VFGKFHRKAVERTFMQAGDKSFDYLPGQQFQIPETGELFFTDA
jgi:hypothetical protein